MFGLGMGELVVIFVLALLFIGPKKLPELAKGLGKGIREFQKAKDGLMNEVETSVSEQKIQPVSPTVVTQNTPSVESKEEKSS